METFFTTSDKIQHIIKSFNLTKTLFVSSIIIGDTYTGKKSLARYLFPEAHLVSGANQEEVQSALENYDELIITDFEKLSNQSNFDFSNKRIIATANYIGNSTLIDDLFAFIYTMPPLAERPEDVDYLKNLFMKEAVSTLKIEPHTIDKKIIPLNLTMNSKSLKKYIFLYLAQLSMDDKDIIQPNRRITPIFDKELKVFIFASSGYHELLLGMLYAYHIKLDDCRFNCYASCQLHLEMSYLCFF